MLVIFANNQTMVAMHNNPMTIFTDPVPLEDNDRASAACTVHSMFSQGGTGQLVYTAQTSNDGGNTWFDSAAVTDQFTAAGSDIVVGPQYGVLVRFKYVFSLTGSSAGNIGSCCFDLHVNLDHA